jgi:lysozyme
MKTSAEGVALIKKFEGCKLDSYLCSGDVWTFGYGHTRGVKEGSSCTQEQAEEMLVEDLFEFEKYVHKFVNVSLDQNQFDALVSWTFNLGPTNLKESTLLKKINVQDFSAVPTEIKRWNRAGGEVVQGLVRRREAEALLWQGEPWENV